MLSSEDSIEADNGKQDYRVEGKFWGGAELKGPRVAQEDRMVAHEFSVVQGEAYQALVDLQKEALIQDTFEALTTDIAENRLPDGSTVISAWIEPKTNTVWSASLGDSEIFAVILSEDGKTKSVGSLNNLHNPDDSQEIERLTTFAKTKDKTLQDIVRKDRVQKNRLRGELAVSRSLGDIQFEDYGMSHNSSVKKHEFGHLEVGERLFIIVACDGLTEYNPKSSLDCLSKADIGLLVSNNQGEDLGQTAEILATAANVRGSKDNISVQVTEVTSKSLKDGPPFMLSIFDGHGGQKTAQFAKENFTKAYLTALAKHEPEILNAPPFVALSLPSTQELDSSSDDASPEEIKVELDLEGNSNKDAVFGKTKAVAILSAFEMHQAKIDMAESIKLEEKNPELRRSDRMKGKQTV